MDQNLGPIFHRLWTKVAYTSLRQLQN